MRRERVPLDQVPALQLRAVRPAGGELVVADQRHLRDVHPSHHRRRRKKSGNTWGWFHQKFFAKRKDTGAQHLAKNLPFNFTNILPQSAQLNSPNLWSKFPKIPKNSPNAMRHLPVAISQKRHPILRTKNSPVECLFGEIGLLKTTLQKVENACRH